MSLSATKVGDLAILELEMTNSRSVHHDNSSNNAMKPIDIPDMKMFPKFGGKLYLQCLLYKRKTMVFNF